MDEVERQSYRQAADTMWERGLFKLDPTKRTIEQDHSDRLVRAYDEKNEREEKARTKS